MRKQKILCLFVATVLLFALLAGCVGKSTMNSREKDVQTKTALSDSADKEKSKEFGAKDKTHNEAKQDDQVLLQKPTNDQTTNETKPEQKELSISKDEQYKANIFLSNFSEQFFHESFLWDEGTNESFLTSDKFEVATADVMELVHFSWVYAKINMTDEVELVIQDDFPYYGVDIETINSVSIRFFDRKINLSDICSDRWDEYNPNEFLVVGNNVCLPAADGETYNHMTVANKMYDLGDGTRKIEFTIYSISDMGGEDSIVLSGGIVQDKSVYYYTAEDANANQYFDYYLSGVAVVKPYTTEKGTATYQLVSYELISDKQLPTSSGTASSDAEDHTDVTTHSINISEEEAYQIACDYWDWTLSESENDEHNSNYSEGADYELYLFYDGLYEEADGKQYYNFRMRWKVPGEIRLSTVDFLYIDAETGACLSTLLDE